MNSHRGPSIAARVVLLLVLLALGAAVTAYDILYRFPHQPNPKPAAPVHVTIPKGVGPKTLAAILDQAALIRSPGRFALWLRATGGMKNVKAGEFEVPSNLTPAELLAHLSGRTTHKGTRVVFPEGFTLTQIARALDRAGIIAKADFLEKATDPSVVSALGLEADTLEGYLFPDTYYFDKGTDAESLLGTMMDHFNAKVTPLGIPADRRRETVILASIIQAETGHNDEMPTIAGVYVNRLDALKHPTTRLQADPTVAYGCEPYVRPRAPSCATFKGTLGRRQLDDPANPYNTYRHPGLPPGPICAPGLDAIRAALSPRTVPFLYFVASDKGDGRHVFSSTLSEHEAAVRAYRGRSAPRHW